MVLWYVLVLVAVLGLWLMVKRDPTKTLPLVLLIAAIALVYGTIVANAGSLFRYRAQEIVLLGIPAAVGVSALWDRWLGSRSRRARH